MIDIVVEPTKLIVDRPNDLTIWLANPESKTVTNIVCRLVLPAKVVLRKGSNRIEASRIAPGQKVRHTIQVVPKSSGTFAITSPNFSYRDGFGKSQRIKDLCLQITVIKKIATPPPPEAKIKLQILTTELSLNQWTKLEGMVSNVGLIALQSITLKVVGRVECDKAVSLGSLPASTNARFSLLVRACESGSHVPFSVEVTDTDIIGRTNSRSIAVTLRVTETMHKNGSSKYGGIHAETVQIVEHVDGGDVVANKYASEQKPTLAEAAAEIQQLLEQLEKTYPTNTTAEKMVVATKAIERIESDPNWKQRVVRAASEGGLAVFEKAIEKAMDNPIGAFIVGAVKGWVGEAE